MDSFSYKCRNQSGEIIQGKIEANSTQDVVLWMRSSGLFPIDIRQDSASSRDYPAWLQNLLKSGKTLNKQDLLMFTRQMGTMIKAGVPLIQAINALKTTSDNPQMASMLQVLNESLDKGYELSVAMSQFPDFFDLYYVNMVKVGESSGHLDEVFKRLHAQIEFDRKLSKKLSKATRYPAFVLIAISLAFIVMMVFIVPSFTQMYANSTVPLPLVTQALIGISNFMRHGWLVGVVIAISGYLAINYYLKQPDGRYQWDRFKLKIPVIGSLVRKTTTARFCRAFSTATASDMPLVGALSLIAKVVSNAYYEDRILSMRASLSNGASLHKSFTSSGLFTPLELQIIGVGASSGNVESMISELADLYEEEIDYDAAKLAETLEPLLMAVMASMVGVFMMGIFTPMWDMTQMVGH